MNDAPEDDEPLVAEMPLIPAELAVDPLLAALLHVASFLDLADDELLEPDAAVDVLERVGHYIQQLGAERAAELQAQLDRVAAHGETAEWPEESIEFARRFLYNCGLGEDEEGDTDEDDGEDDPS